MSEASGGGNSCSTSGAKLRYTFVNIQSLDKIAVCKKNASSHLHNLCDIFNDI
jgi:hypothetical protein